MKRSFSPKHLLTLSLALLISGALQAEDKEKKKPETDYPFSVFSDDTTQTIIYRNGDGEIVRLHRKASEMDWQQANLSKMAPKAPKAEGGVFAYHQPEMKLQVVHYRCGEGHVHELRSTNGNRWRYSNLTGQARAPKADSDPMAYFETFNQRRHVVYRTQDGDICELYTRNGEEKKEKDGEQPAGTDQWDKHLLTRAAKGAPKAAGRPFGYAIDDEKAQIVLYRCGDGMIHELSYNDKGRTWTHENISHGKSDRTGVAKRPKIPEADNNGNPIGFYNKANKSRDVFYRTEDDGVCRLSRLSLGDGKHQWSAIVITRDLEAPEVDGQLCCYQTKDMTHVVYRGGDQVQELYSRGGAVWKHHNISKAAKAPDINGDPVGFAPRDATQQFIFARTDGDNLYVLSYSGSEAKTWTGMACKVRNARE